MTWKTLLVIASLSLTTGLTACNKEAAAPDATKTDSAPAAVETKPGDAPKGDMKPGDKPADAPKGDMKGDKPADAPKGDAMKKPADGAKPGAKPADTKKPQ
jgi:hypothetical protein